MSVLDEIERNTKIINVLRERVLCLEEALQPVMVAIPVPSTEARGANEGCDLATMLISQGNTLIEVSEAVEALIRRLDIVPKATPAPAPDTVEGFVRNMRAAHGR